MTSISTGAKYVARLQAAVTKLGTNGTKIPDGHPPKDVTGNEATSKWHDKHKAVCEYLVASVIKRVAEAREKKAKSAVEIAFGLSDAERVPGSDVTHVLDNVSLNVKVTNPRVQLDRAKLITALSTRGIKDVAKIVEEAEGLTAAPRTLSASTTAE